MCRAFLPPYKDGNGRYKFEGRFNMGVCSINLPQIGILSMGNEEKFFEILDKRMDLVKRVGILRYEHLKNVTSDVSPIHWQYGAISRLPKHAKIEPLLRNGYSTVTIGYIGLYETSKLVTGQSNTTPEGREFALKVMHFLNKKKEEWIKETGLQFAVYGTPAESLTHRFCKIDRERFGVIKDITDKGYYTNSFHVDVREDINVFEKFKFESEFQKLSSGGYKA